MIQPLHQKILQKLSEICELSPDVRFGQMIDFTLWHFWEMSRLSTLRMKNF
jgi:hypothetical protein